MNDTISDRLSAAGRRHRMHNPDVLPKFLDPDTLEVGSDGEVVDIDSKMKNLRNEYPELFKPGPYDPKSSKPVEQQVGEWLERERKDAALEAHARIPRLDAHELTEDEFQAYSRSLTTSVPLSSDLSKLEAAAKRQADARDVGSRGLTRVI